MKKTYIKSPIFFIRVIILIFTIFVFARTLIWGKRGILASQQLKQKIAKKIRKIEQLNKEIFSLQEEIAEWRELELEKVERLARRDLLMAYPNEYIYLHRKN